MVNGVLYATRGIAGAVMRWTRPPEIALESTASMKENVAAPLPGSFPARAGLLVDGKEQRILYVTPGFRLICLDAKTGVRIPSFGNNGEVEFEAE